MVTSGITACPACGRVDAAEGVQLRDGEGVAAWVCARDGARWHAWPAGDARRAHAAPWVAVGEYAAAEV